MFAIGWVCALRRVNSHALGSFTHIVDVASNITAEQSIYSVQTDSLTVEIDVFALVVHELLGSVGATSLLRANYARYQIILRLAMRWNILTPAQR